MVRYLGRGALALALVTALLAPIAGSAAAAAPAMQLPSCAEGPQRVGDEVLGTPCADEIVAPPTATVVAGGPGNDVIRGSVTTAQSGDQASGLHLEVGSQTFEGGAGDDIVYGDRGNDRLRGNAGNDRLYGGIGDDTLEGGEGDDLLAGGFGEDRIDGGAGNDYVRGDATVDRIADSGGGFDTLSFATGASPGFGATANPTGAANFPGPEGERGVQLELAGGGINANDGEPSLGGGNDEVQPGAFERIIGTPFSDYIIGSLGGEEIWGGGGADVVKGGGGPDALHGGADGDYLEAAPEGAIDGEAGSDNCLDAGLRFNCEGTAAAVTPRAAAAVSVGETLAAPGLTQVYLVGSPGTDLVAVTYANGNVAFSLAGGSFDTSAADAGGCLVTASTASCPVAGLLDAVVLAGMGGNDVFEASLPDGVGFVELGGAGEDSLSGTIGEDILVDGEGDERDVLAAGPGDDALTHNGGADILDGGEGSDLFLSVSICDGETISGGAAGANDRDNASWARLRGIGVDARIDQGRVGETGSGDEPQCGAGANFDGLLGIEDLEGSSQSDVLYGDEGANQLFGHKGEDSYRALGGNDNLLANAGTRDRVIDCGPGTDQALIDFASVGDPTPIECEVIREGGPEEFDELPLLTPPPPPLPPPPPPPPSADRTPPRTRLLRHPAKLLRVASGGHKRIAFRFGADEAASFECKLDRKPFTRCRSPRRYRVGTGRHAFHVAAVDVAGNRDRTPALFAFKVVAFKHNQRQHRGPAHPTR